MCFEPELQNCNLIKRSDGPLSPPSETAFRNHAMPAEGERPAGNLPVYSQLNKKNAPLKHVGRRLLISFKKRGTFHQVCCCKLSFERINEVQVLVLVI